MTKHRANNRSTPSERLIAWMKEQIETGHPRGYSSEFLSRKLGVTRSYIDQIRQGKKPLTVPIAKGVAKIDAEKKANTDPGSAIRWQYLMCEDDFYSENEYAVAAPYIQALSDVAMQLEVEDAVYGWLFRDSGFKCKRTEGGYLLSVGVEKPRLITHETMKGIRDFIKVSIEFMAQRAYDIAEDRKEAAGDGINEEADN